MDIQTAKQIKIADYLHSLGYSPVKQQGINLWYKSPFREETEASFKVNTEREQWYDFGLGKGGGIICNRKKSIKLQSIGIWLYKELTAY
jgi:DNA primase